MIVGVTVLCAALAHAQLATDLELHEVLSATLTHQDGGSAPAVEPASADGLLAGLPSLSASRLQSDRDFGTDETEIALNLPFKSGQRRNLDETLVALETRSREAVARYRAWYFSGLIRETVWEHRLAELQLEQAGERVQLLSELEQRASLQVRAGALPQYAALLLVQERLDAELAVVDGLARRNAAQAGFSALTGLPAVPAEIVEQAGAPADPAYADHPQLALLALAREQQQALIALGEPATADWNVSVVARSLEGPGPTDYQYGMAVDIPLTIFTVQNQASRTQRAVAGRDFALEADTLRASIRQRWVTLSAEAVSLRQRRELLQHSARVGEQIEAQLLGLRAGTEVEIELLIRRLLEVLARRSEAALIDSDIQLNTARLRQTAGIPL